MFRADASGDIAVQIMPPQQWRMPVDMAARKGLQLGDAACILVQHPGIVHEFRKPDHTGMIHQRDQIIRPQPRAGGFHMGGRHAGRQLHPDIHQGAGGRLQEILDARQPTNIGNFMRIANGGRHAMRGHTAVKFKRGDKAAFNMQMRVDEPRHKDFACDVNFARTLIAAKHPYNRVTTNRHIGWHQIAGDQIKHAASLQHQISGHNTTALINTV